jgi:tetratricopeptide (TPR) repeat protein
VSRAVFGSGSLSVSNEGDRKPYLTGLYDEYIEGQDSTRFANRVSERYGQGTLERLTEHSTREVRRAAVLALGFLGDYECNHAMGRALHDDDRTVRMLAENGIRSVWGRCGDEANRQQLAVIVRLNSAQLFAEAADRAGQLVQSAAWFAEAWNQRAVARFGLRDFSGSIRDCHQALEINPYHFPAAAGMGHAYLQLGNPVSALESFRRALRLNPGLEGVRAQVVRLSRMIEEK